MIQQPAVLIIGGTAAYQIDLAKLCSLAGTRELETPYGQSPIFHRLVTGRGTLVWFFSRHGAGSLDRSARFVNHRANLWAARELGVQLILTWNGVGAINASLQVGDAVIPAALMDWTRSRIASFDDRAHGLEPVDLARAEELRRAARTIDHINSGGDASQAARPFDGSAHRLIQEAVRQNGIRVVAKPDPNWSGPTYVCTEGPRLETAAEIRLAAELGADVVGMTLCPEVWLAAELGLSYASLCLVTNFATGLWHIDPRRQFGPTVAERALAILLDVADESFGIPLERN